MALVRWLRALASRFPLAQLSAQQGGPESVGLASNHYEWSASQAAVLDATHLLATEEATTTW